MTDTPAPKKTRRKFTELEQSELQRQRAIGAQDVLRADLHETKQLLADREERLTATVMRLEKANEHGKAMEKRAQLAEEQSNIWEERAHDADRQLARVKGQLDMLARLGTIPAEPVSDIGMQPPFDPNRYSLGRMR